MILQSHAEFHVRACSIREASRLRIGTAMLASVVALLALLNMIAGAA